MTSGVESPYNLTRLIREHHLLYIIELYSVGYPFHTGLFRSTTRTRGRVPVSSGTSTRVMRVPGYPDNIQTGSAGARVPGQQNCLEA